MPIFTAALGSVSGLAFLSHFFTNDNATRSHHSSVSPLTNPVFSFPNFCRSFSNKRSFSCASKVTVSGGSPRTEGIEEVAPAGDAEESPEDFRLARLSPSHSCKEPNKTIQQIARALIGSFISVKIIQADEENRKLIFSEKGAKWSKYSQEINAGDVFQARVGAVEEYGAFVHLRFPDEVSWDFVQDIRDVLNAGDAVRVKILSIDSEKSRITLSIKQLEEDPLLETLEKVIPQNGSVGYDSLNESQQYDIEPLLGLEIIIEELLKEKGINDIKITRQGFEKRVVSQDLQLWLSNAPATGEQFTLLARAGRQVQEIQLTTSLDQEGIKKALQRVLERVP